MCHSLAVSNGHPVVVGIFLVCMEAVCHQQDGHDMVENTGAEYRRVYNWHACH